MTNGDRIVPALPSADLDRTAKFYRYFGFETVGRTDRWLRLALDSLELAFFESPQDWSSGALALVDRICIIRVADVQAWHDRFANTRMSWRAMGAPSLTSIQSAAWDVPAFAVTDRDRNLIWVIQDQPAEGTGVARPFERQAKPPSC